MGGPAASVLLSRALTPLEKDQLIALCAQLSDRVMKEYGGYWFNLQSLRPLEESAIELEYHPPMSLYFHDLDEESSPADIQQITRVTGFHVCDQLSIGAQTNAQTSHYAVGAMTLYLARRYQGLIDLGGTLEDNQFTVWHQGAREADMEQAIQMYQAYFEGHPGHLWSVPYELSEGEYWFSHYCDVEFMTWWLNHPRFRIVK